MYTAENIFLAREERVQLQQELLNKYKLPMLVMRVNYPGVNKDNKLTRQIMSNMVKILSDIFSPYIHFSISTNTAEGPLIIMLLEKDVKKIKQIAIDIENKHLLGRCVDIDVYNQFGTSISRIELGYEMRTCYLCDDVAHICVRSKKHREEEVIKYIKGKYEEYMESFYDK